MSKRLENEENNPQTKTIQYKVAREDDLREGFPVPRDNFLTSINSFALCCENYFYFLPIEAPTHVIGTDQLGIALNISQLWTEN